MVFFQRNLSGKEYWGCLSVLCVGIAVWLWEVIPSPQYQHCILRQGKYQCCIFYFQSAEWSSKSSLFWRSLISNDSRHQENNACIIFKSQFSPQHGGSLFNADIYLEYLSQVNLDRNHSILEPSSFLLWKEDEVEVWDNFSKVLS